MQFAALVFLAVLFLAYSNGANDNFKGVATLFGSGTANYKRALLWATLTTLAGSLLALFVSGALIHSFSGKGLVPDTIVQSDFFLISVALGAALTVFFAAVIGFPISTTHALTGALAGAGLASGSGIHFEKFWDLFLFPLLLAPVLAILLTVLVYPMFQFVRKQCRIQKQTCVCINGQNEIVDVSPNGEMILRSSGLAVIVDDVSVCRTAYTGSMVGIQVEGLLNILHYITAGIVSFARGLNDTPKIIALAVASKCCSIPQMFLLTGLTIALGGLLNARKVAQTMSKKITTMDHGQGLTANLITSFLVIYASGWGLPVSTTHVSCGSLFGIGLVNGKADRTMIAKILMSWLITLPLAAVLAGGIFMFLKV